MRGWSKPEGLAQAVESRDLEHAVQIAQEYTQQHEGSYAADLLLAWLNDYNSIFN